MLPGRSRESVLPRYEAQALASSPLAAYIDRRRGVVTNQHSGKAGTITVLLEEHRTLLRHAILQATRESLAVENHESPPDEEEDDEVDEESEDVADEDPESDDEVDEESEDEVDEDPESDDEVDEESEDVADEDPGLRLSLPE